VFWRPPAPRGVRLEYQSLFALGPLCGIDDPEMVLRAARACDDAGIDTISTGGTIAFLMDCVERGWIDGRVGSSGRSLRFGDGGAVLDAIDSLMDRAGLGLLLALGSRRAAERIGGSRARRGVSFARDRLESMIAASYQARGWTRAGRVPESLRRELGLDAVAFGPD
jgi:aldehyde:ferredoxin oxidoreductase